MKQTIIDYIKTELLAGREANIEANDDLLGSGLIDSMAIMRLIAFLEQQFGLQIPQQDMTIENFMTVSDIEAYLTKRLAIA